MNFFKSMIVLMLLTATIFAQFSKVDIKIEAENLKPQEKSDLAFLEGQIKSYIEDYEWIENKYDIDIPIRINIYVQQAQISASERKFSGQLIIVTESNDLQLFEKKMTFNYSQNEALIHSTEIKSLASLLDYYVYIVIATELDTYDLLGGSNLFEKARSIGSRAEMSSYAAGWSDRLKELDELIELRYFRQFKFYYWSIIDLETNGNKEEIPENMEKTFENLELELRINNRNRYMHLFLDAHAKNFAELIKLYGTKEQKEQIILLDPDNKKIYKKALENN